MKTSIPFLMISLLMFASDAAAQRTDTFDLATFQPPNGWQKQAGADGVQFSTEGTDGTFCLISLFRSVPSLGNPKENFDAAWGTVVKTAVNTSSAPQMQPASSQDGWEIVSGAAPFEKDGVKGAAVLVTATGYGRMVNSLVLTNTDKFEKNIAAFLQSVSLKKPVVQDQPKAPAVRSGSQVTLAGNFWKQGGIRGGMLGHSGLSTATFSKSYHFRADGTYIYLNGNRH